MSRVTALLMVGSVLVLAALPAPASAQTGVTIQGGVMGANGETELEAGVRVSRVRHSGVGVDFAVATLPRGLSEGIVNAFGDFDVDVHVALSTQAHVSLRAGGSVLVLAGSEFGAGAGGGFNLGAGIVLDLSGSAAFRIDFTEREFIGGDGLGLSSFTLGITLH